MYVIINPGTGPVGGARLREAVKNIRAWCRDAAEDLDAGGPYTWERDPQNDDDGRYGFRVTHMRRNRRRGAKPTDKVECRHTVEMPGIPLERVRFLNRPEQNILHYPRLYLDGSSWVWLWSFPNCDCEENLPQPRIANPQEDQ